MTQKRCLYKYPFPPGQKATIKTGAANSNSARISFFGSTKGELAQKLDRGQDAVKHRRLTQVPPKPCEMVAYYTAH